ncbi:hypothetical protein GO988_11260 [Hymenobacter sp. HMF4947]|uniref:Lipoprotein n=1 Tax=Hymenobacter ginkgonis TaxID=2682976 RepID=A0A7K1TF27_9BACT|nr:hypothetical protein [Hymenobacter ginkgonis]MVN76902.1 hypothetical protein [Hymenobacter ginkgonis]
MKKPLLLVIALAALASCRESNMATQSSPTTGAAARIMRYDTTFIKIAQRTRAFRYVADLRVGNKSQVTIPVEIDWTSTVGGGCPQVASIQVYQLNGGDRRTGLRASVVRDATCRPGLQPDGTMGTATGAAMLSITGESKETKFFTTTKCLLTGLGYHDSLSYDNVSARR